MLCSLNLLFSDVAVALAVVVFLGPVHTTPEEFENGGFTLKTLQMFSVHTRKGIRCFPSTLRRRNLKTQQSQAGETLECIREHSHNKVLVEPAWLRAYCSRRPFNLFERTLKKNVEVRPKKEQNRGKEQK